MSSLRPSCLLCGKVARIGAARNPDGTPLSDLIEVACPACDLNGRKPLTYRVRKNSADALRALSLAGKQYVARHMPDVIDDAAVGVAQHVRGSSSR
jgi:hypothetical protein